MKTFYFNLPVFCMWEQFFYAFSITRCLLCFPGQVDTAFLT